MSIQCALVVLYMYMYTLTYLSSTDRVIAIAMTVVSVAIVLPVAGPVALITYIVLKKLEHDDKNGQPLNNNSYFLHAHLHVLYSVRAHGALFLEHMMYMM